MITRRNFLQTAAVAGSSMVMNPIRALSSRHQNSSGFFGIHPFIENNPDAVFIMRTEVDEKMNSGAKLAAGLAFGRSIFVAANESGIPINISIPVKPNLKTANPDKYPLEDIIGTVTDPYFSGQLIEVLVNEYRRAGSHMAVWNTNSHASGIYFYRFRFGSFTDTKKMMLIK